MTSHKVLGTSEKLTLAYDLDGDGRFERLVTTEKGTTCYEADGSVPRWDLSHPIPIPSLADINADRSWISWSPSRKAS